MVRNQSKITVLLRNGADHSSSTSTESFATNGEIGQYCQTVDLPGLEDNISPGKTGPQNPSSIQSLRGLSPSTDSRK